MSQPASGNCALASRVKRPQAQRSPPAGRQHEAVGPAHQAAGLQQARGAQRRPGDTRRRGPKPTPAAILSGSRTRRRGSTSGAVPRLMRSPTLRSRRASSTGSATAPKAPSRSGEHFGRRAAAGRCRARRPWDRRRRPPSARPAPSPCRRQSPWRRMVAMAAPAPSAPMKARSAAIGLALHEAQAPHRRRGCGGPRLRDAFASGCATPTRRPAIAMTPSAMQARKMPKPRRPPRSSRAQGGSQAARRAGHSAPGASGSALPRSMWPARRRTMRSQRWRQRHVVRDEDERGAAVALQRRTGDR